MTAALHFSELQTLASCERRWVYKYALGSNDEVGNGAYLGTLLHLGLAQWLNRGGVELPSTWRSEEHSDSAEPGALVTYSLSDFDPEVVEKARWLLGRYAAHYGSEPPSSWRVISTEQHLTAQTPWGTLAGTADAIVEIDGNLWLIEHKSYGSKGRLNWVQVDPQLGVYDLLVQANYCKPAFGILFNGIYTYRWKPKQRTLKEIEGELKVDPDSRFYTSKQLTELARGLQADEPGIERDPSESFEQVYVDLSDEHRATTQRYLSAANRRRLELLYSESTIYAEGQVVFHPTPLELAIPNVGRQCDYCSFRPRCWQDLGGVEPMEIEVDDEGTEPV